MTEKEHIAELQSAVSALLEWVDSIPSAVVAEFPTMPGVDRDWVESLLQQSTNPK
jgi:hypothetical protein